MLDKLKNDYILVLLFWLLSIFIFMMTKSGLVAAFSIFYTGLLPFVYIVLWLSKSEIGKNIRKHAKKWHIAVGISWFLFAYAIYAQKWAAGVINQVFFVDASNLGITYTLLAFLFTPFGMLYQESILSGLWNTLIIAAMIWGSIFPMLLMLPIPFKRIAYVFVFSFLVIGFFSLFIGAVTNLVVNKELLIKRFALWADFNNNHLCSDNWANTTDSVLFLGGERVLIYQSKKPENSQFSVKTCNFEKSF
ncbi:hypothetical protein [Thiomicrospira sp.]|uniref:hypothetical protein n=1 Tax=Thiomicrospira sp. TaxID=935 RepID=UPI002F939989